MFFSCRSDHGHNVGIVCALELVYTYAVWHVSKSTRTPGALRFNGFKSRRSQYYPGSSGTLQVITNHSSLVRAYDEADTLVVQHDFMHLSFYKDELLTKVGGPTESKLSGSSRPKLIIIGLIELEQLS